MAAGRWRRDPARPLHRPSSLRYWVGHAWVKVVSASPSRPTPPKYRDGAEGGRAGSRPARRLRDADGGRRMQGLVLQLTRVGFLSLAAFIWSARRDPSESPAPRRCQKRGLALRGTLLPSAETLPANSSSPRARLQAPTLCSAPSRVRTAGADSTLVSTHDYASTRHARLSQRGAEWYVEDLGSTNGTYLDRAKVTDGG